MSCVLLGWLAHYRGLVNTVLWQRVEAAVVAIGLVALTVHLGFAWWWLLALFLVYDASAAGYAAGPRLGAWCYNAVHNFAGPAALAVTAVLADWRWGLLIALTWAFHVAVDRALGYGLKQDDHFQHTHLGWIGRPAGRAAKESTKG